VGIFVRSILALLILLAPQAAFAGAWTMPRGDMQIIASSTWSGARSSFDSKGSATVPAEFEKSLSSIDIEYGWNNWLTLLADPEYAYARQLRPDGRIESDHDWAEAGGVRVRLMRRFGVLSMQFTAKSAGAYAMDVSRDGAAGRQLETRLLYGTNFGLFGKRGYIDLESGYRWIAGPRADEIPVDVTLGYRITWRTWLMFQSFNIVAMGNARAPYQYYRQHKLEFSTVTWLSQRLSIQSGAFISPAGQNSLAEQGGSVAIWLRF
jgi:protein XagA